MSDRVSLGAGSESNRDRRIRLAFKIDSLEYAYADLPKWRAIKRFRVKRQAMRTIDQWQRELAAAWRKRRDA
jgi:hypothetical protein